MKILDMFLSRSNIKQNVIIILGMAIVMGGVILYRALNERDKDKLGPDNILNIFYGNLCSGNFSEAYALCDSLSMDGYIGGFRNEWEKNSDNVKGIASDILAEMSVSVTGMEKNGQSRTIFFELAAINGYKKEKAATIRKEEGAWKIEKITDIN